MPQVQPVFRVSGSVHSTRVETWEAGTNKNGRPFSGGQYGEITLLTDRSALDGEITDIPTTVVLRCDVEQLADFPRGTMIEANVTPFSDFAIRKGRPVNFVSYRLAAVEQASPSRNGAVTTGS